jgi:hypothetical protein
VTRIQNQVKCIYEARRLSNTLDVISVFPQGMACVASEHKYFAAYSSLDVGYDNHNVESNPELVRS